MSFVENQDARVYWDDLGRGEPLLMINGLGTTAHLWHRSRSVFAKSFRTIALDNRGVGRSDAPAGVYSISLMASDAVAVLDAAGIDEAHVLGVSLGGMIAQELALQHPRRVRSLILGCTAAGELLGPHAVAAEPEALLALMRRGTTPEESNEAFVPFLYDVSTPRERIDEDMAVRLKWYPTAQGYMGQLQGVSGWDAYERLTQITAPTLVIHGETDRLIPPANAAIIAKRIPGAKLVLIPHAGHVFWTDQPSAAHHAILEFLGAQRNAVSAGSVGW
ncbi:MAG: alpha/beta fold hydrolase [Steroidobacteraceae bacterium]